MRKIAISALFSVLIGVVGPFCVPYSQAQTAAEAGFNPNTIIADDQMNDYLGMSVGRIQEFLSSQTGVLKNFTDTDGRSAAQIIYDASQVSRINPKVLLTSIQKESSMLTRSSFSTSGYSGSQQYYLDWVTFYGWCDSCTTGVNKGFANQISSTAAAFRRYLDLIASSGTSISGWGPGVTKNIPCISSDYTNGRAICTPGKGFSITPTNAATSALYTYTPHPGGNYAFWIIWNGYNFNQRRVYPDGTLLQAKGSADVYILQNGVKRKFSSQKVLLSRYSLNQVVTVTPDALFQYDTGTPIYYANYTLLIAPNRGVYLVSADYKQPIRSKKALLQTGLDPKSAVKVGWNVLDNIPLGPSITDKDIYPAGAILQDASTGGIYFVKDGVRYPVPSGDIYKSQFGTQKAKRVPAAELASYPRSVAVGFRDGTLVKSKTARTIYFISNGYRLPIASADAAKAYGFDKLMKSVITTDDKSLNVHPLGPILDVDSNMVTLASQ